MLNAPLRMQLNKRIIRRNGGQANENVNFIWYLFHYAKETSHKIKTILFFHSLTFLAQLSIPFHFNCLCHSGHFFAFLHWIWMRMLKTLVIFIRLKSYQCDSISAISFDWSELLTVSSCHYTTIIMMAIRSMHWFIMDRNFSSLSISVSLCLSSHVGCDMTISPFLPLLSSFTVSILLYLYSLCHSVHGTHADFFVSCHWRCLHLNLSPFIFSECFS